MNIDQETVEITIPLPNGKRFHGRWEGAPATILNVYLTIAMVIGIFWPVGLFWLFYLAQQ